MTEVNWIGQRLGWNPFPSVGTQSLEDLQIIAEDPSRVIVPLTYPFGQVVELRSLCQAYLNRFPTFTKGQGMTFMVIGDHGTGKTHTLGDVLFRIAADQLIKTVQLNELNAPHSATRPPNPRRPFLLYAKAMGSSIQSICQDLLRRLSTEDYRQLGLDAVEFLATPGSAGPDHLLVERFLADLTAATVWRERSNSLRLAKGRMDDFPRAYSYLLAPELGLDTTLDEAARSWLTIQDVSEADMKKLGINEPLRSAADSVQSVHFLTMLCSLANRPLVVVIDQCESFVAPLDEQRPSETILHLQSLVEMLPRENSLFLLAGTPRAWRAFPPDLQQRLKYNVIPCDRLSLQMARNVLALYLNPIGRQGSSDDASDEDIRPFTPGAVKELLERGGGMLRQLMQIASRAFDMNTAKDGTEIDAGLIGKAASLADVQANDPASVRGAIRDSLQVRGVPFTTDYELGGQTVDFAVLLPSGDPRLLIKVSRSAFFLDEANSAEDLLRLARAALGVKSRPLLLPIFAGYASPEVLTELRKVTHAVIVYDADGFKESIEGILGALPEPPQNSGIESSRSSTDPLLHRIDRIEKALEILSTARQPVYQALERGLEGQGQRQASTRQELRRREAIGTWVQERSRIEGQLKQSRAVRERNEIAELTKLRDSGEAERRMRADWVAVPVIVFAVLVGVILAIGVSRDYSKTTELERELLRLSRDSQASEMKIEELDRKIAAIQLPDDSHSEVQRQNYEYQRDRNLDIKAQLTNEIKQQNDSILILRGQLETAAASQQSQVFVAICAIIGVAFVTFRSMSARHLNWSSAARTLAARVDTLSDLRSRAQMYVRFVKENSLIWTGPFHSYGLTPPHSRQKLLSDVNPHLRYAATLPQDYYPRDAMTCEDFTSALLIEGSSVVRRALASAIGTTWPTETQLPMKSFAADLPEIAYWVESVAMSLESESMINTNDWPIHLQLVYELNRLAGEQGPNPVETVASLLFSSRDAATQFAEAYNNDNILKDPTFLATASDIELREAVKLFSPFDQVGLGMLHRLKAIDKIDRWYLLFCQASWYKQWQNVLLLSNDTN